MNIHIDEHTNRIKVKIQYFKILQIIYILFGSYLIKYQHVSYMLLLHYTFYVIKIEIIKFTGNAINYYIMQQLFLMVIVLIWTFFIP